MLTRMETSKFKVFNTLLDWFEEFRLFHRKDGKVVKDGDDLLAAIYKRLHQGRQPNGLGTLGAGG